MVAAVVAMLATSWGAQTGMPVKPVIKTVEDIPQYF